jgi:pyruvate dehydrogenase (quinone)
MSGTVGDFVVGRLHEWGVRRIYGYPGDGINGFMGALQRVEGTDREVRFVQARHEELAAFMACAHAKFSDEVGVCLATSGPGAIHLLNGLYDAAMDHVPVVAIVGQQATTAIGSDYQQEVDLISLFKDVAHHFVHMCTTPAQARHLVDRAFRIAKAERSVTCIIFPNDVQEMEEKPNPPRIHGTTFTGVGYSSSRIIPAEDELDRAAAVLNESRRVGMLIGAGALGATEEVIRTADVLGAGVAKALLGKAALADHFPFVTGGIGLLGTEPSDYLMRHCDGLLMVGTAFPYSEWLPKPGDARAVQIDIAPRMLSLRYPCEVNLHGDAKETLRALLPRLERKEDRSWREKIEKRVGKWWDLLESRAMKDARPINPQRVFWELSPLLPDNCVITADSGSCANWFARDLKIRPGMMASLSGSLATMCPGVPYALAAKFVHPNRSVIACVGDGAMQMLGMNGLITIAHHYHEWPNKQLIILVLNNGDLNQVTWEQRVMAGDPKFQTSQVLPHVSFARYADLLGLDAVVMREPSDIVPGWRRALSSDRPCIVEAYTDPEVPPLPPHIDFKKAKAYWTALLKGEPDRGHIIRQSVKDMFA